MTIQLGATYVDKITRFRGVAIAHCEYLTGCHQTLIQPEGKDSTVRPQSEWFDDQRLDPVKTKVLVLDNSTTPGCDRQAPRRHEEMLDALGLAPAVAALDKIPAAPAGVPIAAVSVKAADQLQGEEITSERWERRFPDGSRHEVSDGCYRIYDANNVLCVAYGRP
ncbi:MAG: hypothetical protein DI597_19320 [Pseudoxanthomonas spadix]|nr:MAG: hypothetical protein DI597_19320 [Pseudoxanthomonas spadix]